MHRTILAFAFSSVRCASIGACALACLPAAAPAQSIQEVYRNLKSLEGRIPLPTTYVVARVPGNFPPIFNEPEAVRPGGRPPAVTPRNRSFTANANAVNVGLKFESTHRALDPSVTCD